MDNNFYNKDLANHIDNVIGVIKKIDRNGFTTWITLGRANGCSHAIIVDAIGHYCYDEPTELRDDIIALQYLLDKRNIRSYRIEFADNVDSDLRRMVGIPRLNQAPA